MFFRERRERHQPELPLPVAISNSPTEQKSDVKNQFVDFLVTGRKRNIRRNQAGGAETDIDTAPANPEQLSRIIKLGQEGHLRRLSSKVLLKLCHLSAERLIWRGEMNRRRSADVSD